MTRLSDTDLASAYRGLEDIVCDVRCMVRLAWLAHEGEGGNTPELVLSTLRHLDDLSEGLKRRYYAGFGEVQP